ASCFAAASMALTYGATMSDATLPLLGLDDTARCFLLDASGRQIGDNVLPDGRTSQRAKRFRPLLHSEGASWERRPYFIGARKAPGRVQFTPPYLSINEAHLCVTASVALQTEHGVQVLCVDINWDAALRG
ncbi:EAL domain-containing protein, partial [Paraburkholderia sp. BR14319]